MGSCHEVSAASSPALPLCCECTLQSAPLAYAPWWPLLLLHQTDSMEKVCNGGNVPFLYADANVKCSPIKHTTNKQLNHIKTKQVNLQYLMIHNFPIRLHK
ncbi:hypothetical protein E2C01_008054 [Portunus trituberculatus]|uniref:Uncharacterized protein n=1 Tax=Portunus trituberculatus TaxID=210409 RepID=A0A5B7D1B0_PORTR|nr:hypothetical protein [Portunus trituberculatus]